MKEHAFGIIALGLIAGALLLAEGALTWQQREQLRAAIRTHEVDQTP